MGDAQTGEPGAARGATAIGGWGDGPVHRLDSSLRRARLMARMVGETRPLPRLGRFEIVRRRGGGGQGAVYEALDPLSSGPVALKWPQG